MSFKNPGFEDRAAAAANAKKALLEKFKAKPPADDPAVVARQAERLAVQQAREQRVAERKAAKLAKEREEAAARKAAEEAAELARLLAIEEEAERERQLLNEQKAARDARYAARKARRRGAA